MLGSLLKAIRFTANTLGWVSVAQDLAKSARNKALLGKRQADDALDLLRAPLAQRVGRDMEERYGPGWMKADPGAKVVRHPPDALFLLKTVIWNWDEVFGADPFFRDARSAIHLCMEGRARGASQARQMTRRELLQYIEAIWKLADVIGADSGPIRRLYSEQEREAAEVGML